MRTVLSLLKKVWDKISEFFGGGDMSVNTKKDIQKNTVKGDNNGSIIQGDVNNSIIAEPGSSVKIGADIKISREEPTDQETDGIWLKEE